jgi:prolyl-tRNA editing enzyme YbaK/EbsC (Cys-tRNA(Pro) deacylase)
MLKPLAPVGPPGDSHIAASLTQHLLSQNAPRAAARVSGHEPTQPEPCAYAVAPDSVTLVDTAALAARFSGMLHELLHAPATVGLDLEWRPDTLQNVHRPSLLQLATSTHVWLVDLDAAPSSTPALLDAVAALLASSEHRILGFGLQVDLDRLQSVCHREDAPLIARGVVDLRDACLCGAPLSSETGLAAQLRAWTGKSLDKAMQCSDWAARPLSDTQIAYAAADAMSLVELDRAIGSWACGGPPDAPRDDPRRECTLVARCPSLRTGRARPPAKADEAEAEAEDEDEDEDVRQAGDEGLRLVRAALASLPCAHAGDCWLADSPAADGANAAGRAAEIEGEIETEINALCFTAGDGELGRVLVLVPALAPKVDLRWLALAINCPKRKLQLASDDQCVADFGAVPGRVPPLPLRPGVRVLCDPRLCDAAVVWGSSCDARQRLFIRKPRLTLPALAAAAAAAAAAPVAAGMFAASTFEWLPPPER